jgi:hypothetical protein
LTRVHFKSFFQQDDDDFHLHVHSLEQKEMLRLNMVGNQVSLIRQSRVVTTNNQNTNTSPQQDRAKSQVDLVIKVMFIGSLFVLSLIVAFSRYYLGVHTQLQVLVGSLLGCFSGLLWSALGHWWIRPLVYRWCLQQRWFQLFYWKDSGPIADVLRTDFLISNILQDSSLFNKKRKQQS